jgi:DNA-binding response OmpR family regulator
VPVDTRRPLRVVVADDERDTVLTLMTLLEEEGYQVRGLYGGAEVPDTVRDFHPDAVLVDLAMPDKSGFQIAQEIRSRPGGGLPLLIAISGRYKQGSDRILSELVGFDHHVAKPYDLNALLRLLAPLSI